MRIYRLTAAGSNALRDVRSVPDWYRAILELVRNDATIGKVITGIRDYPSREVLTWIEQLETLGFVESLLVPRASNTGRSLEAPAWNAAKRA